MLAWVCDNREIINQCPDDGLWQTISQFPGSGKPGAVLTKVAELVIKTDCISIATDGVSLIKLTSEQLQQFVHIPVDDCQGLTRRMSFVCAELT